MPPRKEVCRNFARGSCQYGDRCKFLHVSPQQSKPNPFGFGMQVGQHQNTSFQQQKPYPSGFNVQNSFQSRAASEFGSKQNQNKPFENKWTRSSSTNAAATRQPDNQPSAPSHQCTDPESCKRQIAEDFEKEAPIWKLTCYGHSKNGPCDIVGDTSYEELRASAYDDAKRGLSLNSIVERERSLVFSKVHEFESLLRNPYKGPLNSAFVSPNHFGGTTQSPSIAPQTTNSPFGGMTQTPTVAAQSINSPFVGVAQTPSVAAQSTNPPSFSSFSQLGTSLNTGVPAAPNSIFGLPNPFQNNSQKIETNSMQNQNSGFGGQPHGTHQSPVTSGFGNFSNNSTSSVQNPVATSAFFSQIPGFSDGQSSFQNVLVPTAIGSSTLSKTTDGDNSIWLKEEWRIGEIPEEAPPDMYCN